MKLFRMFLLFCAVSSVFLWAAAVFAADLQVSGEINNTQTYDSPEGIIFNAAVINSTANVTANAAYEVILKPGTAVKAGARLLIRLKDNDGLPNRWEMEQCGTLQHGPGDDPDGDGMTMLQEYQWGTLACRADTDGDGMPDVWEVQHDLDPLVNDSEGDADNDGLSNLDEYLAGTDPHNPDTDGDGMRDGWEIQYGLNPLSADADADADGDGFSNIMEYQLGTDPTDKNDKPPVYQFNYDLNGNLTDTQQP